MQQRRLGSSALTLCALGLGRMGMGDFHSGRDDDASIATTHRALDLGVAVPDTADMHGPFTNERRVGRTIRDRRDAVVLATKLGDVRGEDGHLLGIEGSAEHVRRACDASPAHGRQCRPTRLALAWLLAQRDDVVPIPGTTDRARVDAVAPTGVAAGTRHPEAGMRTVDR